MANETEKKLILVHHQNPLKFSETMQGLKAQRDNGEFCDVKMNIEGKQIFAHSCVLAANSPHLKTHFLDPSNWSVGLAFPATNVQTTEALIDYMYTSFLGVHLDIMEDLIAAAEQLQMTDIPALCEDYLIQTLSLSNWLSVRRIARQCSLTSAIAHVRSWISCHLSEIISNSDFLELDKSDVILILTDSVDKKQAELLEAVLTWLCHDFQQRKEFYTELLDNVIDMAFLPADCSQKIEENPKFNEIAKNEVTIELLRKLREETSLNNCANDGHESEAVTETEHFSDQETAKNVLPMSRSEKKSRGRPPKQKAKTSEAELHAEPDPKDGVKVKTSAKPKQTSTHSEMQPRVDIAERNWSLSLADINNSNAGKKRKVWKCPWENCSYETLYQRSLEKHEEWHRGVRPEVCEVCGDGFVNDKYLLRHTKLHTGRGKKYNCPWCPYETLRSDKLRDHTKNAHPSVALKLNLYKKGAKGKQTNYVLDSDTEEDLQTTGEKSSEQTDKAEPSLELDDAGLEKTLAQKKRRTFRAPQQRTKRVAGQGNRAADTDAGPSAPVPPKRPRGRPSAVHTEKNIACPKCPRKFYSEGQMRHHLRGHGSDLPMLCEICGFSTKHYCAMKLHKNVHSGDVFRCSVPGCDYFTAVRSLMADHRNRHNDVRNYMCSICGKAFIARKHMRRHELTHAEFKPLACGVCEFRTTRKDKLKEHVRVHHPQIAVAMGYMTQAQLQQKMAKKFNRETHKPYACSYCDFTAPSEGKLVEHVRKKHSAEALPPDVQSAAALREMDSQQTQKTTPLKKTDSDPNANTVASSNAVEMFVDNSEASKSETFPTSFVLQTTVPYSVTGNAVEALSADALEEAAIEAALVETNADGSPSRTVPAASDPLPLLDITELTQVSAQQQKVQHGTTDHSQVTLSLPTVQPDGHSGDGDASAQAQPYIATVMIDGVAVQLQTNSEGELNAHWPAQ